MVQDVQANEPPAYWPTELIHTHDVELEIIKKNFKDLLRPGYSANDLPSHAAYRVNCYSDGWWELYHDSRHEEVLTILSPTGNDTIQGIMVVWADNFCTNKREEYYDINLNGKSKPTWYL
jgi:hypothetical protein